MHAVLGEQRRVPHTVGGLVLCRFFGPVCTVCSIFALLRRNITLSRYLV